MKGYIYKATNTFNGRVYIGQTVAGLPKRRGQHYRDAKADSENAFHLALYQFPGAFEWETIDTFTGTKEFVIHSLNVAEEYHILKYNSTDERYGYNATFGGYSSDKFAEHIRRRQQSLCGTAKQVLQYDKDGEFIREFNSLNEVAAFLGKEKIHLHTITSGLHYGHQWRVKRDEYYPKKISAYKQPQKATIPVVAYDSNGVFYKEFAKIKDAWDETGVNMQPKVFTTRVEIYECHERTFYLFRKPEEGYPDKIEIIVKHKEKKEPKLNNKRVASYTLDGDFIRVYESIKEAVDDTKSSNKSIVKICNEPLPIVLAPNSKRKINWRFCEGEPPMKIDVVNLRPEKVEKMVWRLMPDGCKRLVPVIKTKRELNKYTKKMEHRIIQYTREGNFVKVWDNTHQAAKSGADSNALIRKSLDGKPTKKPTNFIWRYYTDNYPQTIQPGKILQPKENELCRQDDTIEEISWDGTIIATYKNTADAAAKSGYSQSYICNVLAGKIKHPKRKFRRK